jgi:tetratricopeptide (TPR) repeat protein
MKCARGLEITASDSGSVERFELALWQLQSYFGDPIATIEAALQVDPELVLGHVLRAAALAGLAERRFQEEALASVVAAEAMLARANERERALVASMRLVVDGEWERGCRALDRVLVDHPRDVLALQTAHLFDFYRGDALNLRNRVARVLPAWSPSVPGYSYVLGLYAFGLEESNQYQAAEATGRRALELEQKDPWSIHAVTHVFEMQGRVEEGIEWLTCRELDWAPDNAFAPHNFWHLALFHLDRHRYDACLSLYDARIHPGPPETALQLLDATSLLWRLVLEGVEGGDRARVLADNWAKRMDVERGFYAFNDMHAMMAFVMAGRDAEAAALLGDLEHAAEHARGTNRMMTQTVGLPVCRALIAFGDARYADAIEALLAVRDVASRFGGSHAQRDVLTSTLIEAAIRSGRGALARHVIAERTAEKPASDWLRRLHARASGRRAP